MNVASLKNVECLKCLLCIDSLGILSLLAAINYTNNDKLGKNLKHLLATKTMENSIKQKLIDSQEDVFEICDCKIPIKLGFGNILNNQLGNYVLDGFELVRFGSHISNFKLNIPGTRGCHEVTNNKTTNKILEEFRMSLCSDRRSSIIIKDEPMLNTIFSRHALGNSIVDYLSEHDIMNIALDCDDTLEEITSMYNSKLSFVLAASSIKSKEAKESAAYMLFCIHHDEKTDLTHASKHLKNIFKVAFEKDNFLNDSLKKIASTGGPHGNCIVKPLFISLKNTNLICVVLFFSFTEIVFDDHKGMMRDLYASLKEKNNLKLCNSTRETFSILFDKNRSIQNE